MKVISKIGPFKAKNTSVAIGIFDGMHRGHQYLLKKTLARAKALKLRSMVVTFFPHPAHVLRPDLKLGYLVSMEHRLKMMEELGVDTCVIIPFNKRFAHVEPEQFIRDCLVGQLGAHEIFVGEDFRFGRDRMGDTELFKRLASVYGYHMHAVPSLKSGGEAVSSTRIRRLVSDGQLLKAKQLLGRPFAVLGKVVKGKGKGKGLGFPTANIAYASDVLPPLGVYAAKIIIKGKSYNAAVNLGLRPLFHAKEPKVLLEAYILDFKKDVYGQMVEVQFIAKIRDEQKFHSPAQLSMQIAKDIVRIRRILK